MDIFIFQILKRFRDSSWPDAKRFCESIGAHLPKPTAQWQHELLKTMSEDKEEFEIILFL